MCQPQTAQTACIHCKTLRHSTCWHGDPCTCLADAYNRRPTACSLSECMRILKGPSVVDRVKLRLMPVPERMQSIKQHKDSILVL